MAYSLQQDGRYHIPIVDLGNRLQDNFGLTIGEHSAFGGTSPVHAGNSHHDYDEALDITDWRGGAGDGAEGFDGVGYVQRTKNLTNLLQGSGHEVIGPGSKGHDTHLHIGNHDGIFKLDQNQYNYLFSGKSGGKNSTFAMNTDTSTADTDVVVAPETKAAPPNYATMSKSQMNNEYDKLRKAGDVFAANKAGKEMHKAYFNK